MSGGSKTILSLAFGLVALAAAFGSTAEARGKYNVYCANNKLEVDSRSLEQMKSARGANVCLLAEFGSLGDAEKFASDRGGKGSPCKCN